MSTKPDVTLARWADTGSADVTAPSSGARDTGFVEGDPADQSIVNELIKQLYLWALYLNDGSLTGNHAFSGGTFSVSGTTTISGVLTSSNVTKLTGGLRLNGITSGLVKLQSYSAAPANGNNNNFDPGAGAATSLNDVTPETSAITVNLNATSGSPVITGLVGGADGRIVNLMNNGTVSVQLNHEDTNSTAGNRFKLVAATNVTIPADGAVTLLYEGGSVNRWRILSKSF